MHRASVKHQLRGVGLAVLETEREKPQGALRASSLASRALKAIKRQRGSQLPEAVEAEASHLASSIASALDVHDEDRLGRQSRQEIMLVSAPEGVLRKEAEAREMLRRVLPSRNNNEFLGGFTPSQFDQGGPLELYWAETSQKLYEYQPYFCSAVPEADPSALLSPSERKFLVKRLVTDPLLDNKLPSLAAASWLAAPTWTHETR